jgi:hypothetical protein
MGKEGDSVAPHSVSATDFLFRSPMFGGLFSFSERSRELFDGANGLIGWVSDYRSDDYRSERACPNHGSSVCESVGLARDLNVFSSLVNVNTIKAAENTLGLEVDYLPN